MYDGLIKSHQDILEKELLALQNKAYTKQLEIYKKSSSNIKIFKHDFKNHIGSLKSLMVRKEFDSALKYIEDIEESAFVAFEYVKTENSIVDSILNYKLYEAEKLNIKIDFNISIPETLEIMTFDLTAILGNLLDNAIEAVCQLVDNRAIYFSFVFDCGIIYIKIENPYIGTITKKPDGFVTSKDDKENHGLGLMSIKNILNKYNGTINIDSDDGIFCVDILMYNISTEF